MPSMNLPEPVQAATQASGATQQALGPTCDGGHGGACLLQSTQNLIDTQAADPQYWTEYDYFMLEREARAVRRAYLSGLVSGALGRLRERFVAPRLGPASR
jgi:hypothetical protein